MLICYNAAAFAEWEKPKVEFSNSYRYLFRERHSIYIQRGEFKFSYDRGTDNFAKIKLSPFIELRNNLQKDKLEYKEIGFEFGTDIFPWFYAGESFQYSRYNYDWVNWLWHPRIKYAAEAETRLKFMLPVYQLSEERKIIAYVLNEFTYSFKLAEGTRNEVVLGITIPVTKYTEIGFDWRHIDRIHDFDSDALEANVSLIF
ncbi:MAG: hypothetical protein Q8L26_01770 [Candidatus Omnitrophota bacterium]|nr:hypothetical protein [Candidatus Omnitrophota bacterium]